MLTTAGTGSERQVIEDYLTSFCIEECLDEAINEVVEKRPANPYACIARSMETKTFAEIIDVTLHSIIVGCGQGGCKAVVATNISSFSAMVSYPEAKKDTGILRDFTIQEEKVLEKLKSLDPRNFMGVEKAIGEIPGLDNTITLALSMACARAGARHKGG